MGDVLLDERTARSARTLACALQHHQDTLLAGLSITGTRGAADKQHGAFSTPRTAATRTQKQLRYTADSRVTRAAEDVFNWCEDESQT